MKQESPTPESEGWQEAVRHPAPGDMIWYYQDTALWTSGEAEVLSNTVLEYDLQRDRVRLSNHVYVHRDRFVAWTGVYTLADLNPEVVSNLRVGRRVTHFWNPKGARHLAWIGGTIDNTLNPVSVLTSDGRMLPLDTIDTILPLHPTDIAFLIRQTRPQEVRAGYSHPETTKRQLDEALDRVTLLTEENKVLTTALDALGYGKWSQQEELVKQLAAAKEQVEEFVKQLAAAKEQEETLKTQERNDAAAHSVAIAREHTDRQREIAEIHLAYRATIADLTKQKAEIGEQYAEAVRQAGEKNLSATLEATRMHRKALEERYHQGVYEAEQYNQAEIASLKQEIEALRSLLPSEAQASRGSLMDESYNSGYADGVAEGLRNQTAPPQAPAQDILTEARSLVDGDRRSDYGPLASSFWRIANLWSAVLESRITAQQVGLMLVLLKVARATQGYKRDSLVDIAGYAYCISRLEEEAETEASAFFDPNHWDGVTLDPTP